jgi:hypothetical protein
MCLATSAVTVSQLAWGVVALASGVFAADPAVFVGFLQIGPVDIHKKRRLAGELSGFSPKKASNSPCFVDAGATTPLAWGVWQRIWYY